LRETAVSPLVSAETPRHELGIERRTKAGRGATPHYLRPAAFKSSLVPSIWT